MLKFNKKQLILIALTLILSLGLVGCGKKLAELGNTNANQNQNQNVNLNTNTATTTGEIDTSDWKTYRNEEYGFEFKYPLNWDKEEKNNFNSDTNKSYTAISFFDENKHYNYHFFVGIIVNNNGNNSFSSVENFKKWHSKEMRGNEIKSVKMITINNVIETEEYDGIQSIGKYFYFHNNNSVIYFRIDNETNQEKIFKDITSSFKFIE